MDKLIVESAEKGKLIKEALKIIDELAKLDDDIESTDFEILSNLIAKSKKLKANRLWKLR